MIKVNGEMHDLSGKNITEAISAMGYERTRVAVELNEEIVPKAEYDSTFLNDGDTVEIVSFVGGG